MKTVLRLFMCFAAFGLLAQTTPPLTLAWHGPPYVETVFIPHEVRYLKADYYLRGGLHYKLQFSENLSTWFTVATYDPPVDDTWSPGAAFYVNGMFYPAGFFRMIEE